MKVIELIEKLSKLPQDAEIFEGCAYADKIEGLPLVELYDFEPVYYAKVYSCGNHAPWKRSIKEHVVVLET